MYCFKKKQAFDFENENLQFLRTILGRKTGLFSRWVLNKAHVVFGLGFMVFPCGGLKFNCLDKSPLCPKVLIVFLKGYLPGWSDINS